ncbi:MAG TPA: dihydroneopterin aldolase [Planctomycetota bacterium]|nr:dihydroneopterin aldolase [Planctomycetota bacterium]
MGVVFVRDLSVETVIGVAEHERAEPREVLVNLEMEVDLDAAAASDDLAHAIDYAAVADAVRAHALESRFRLLEAFAASIAQLVLARFPGVDAVSVKVEKAWAVPGARSVGVRLRAAR